MKRILIKYKTYSKNLKFHIDVYYSVQSWYKPIYIDGINQSYCVTLKLENQ